MTGVDQSFLFISRTNRKNVCRLCMLKMEDRVKEFSSSPAMLSLLPNSCRLWERVEGSATGLWGSTVCCVSSSPSTPVEKINFHHWLIYGPLGFSSGIRQSFWILLTLSLKITAAFGLLYNYSSYCKRWEM